jgi:hypothetical protein
VLIYYFYMYIRSKLLSNLQISPDFRQAAALKKMVEDKIAKGELLNPSCIMHCFEFWRVIPVPLVIL